MKKKHGGRARASAAPHTILQEPRREVFAGLRASTRSVGSPPAWEPWLSSLCAPALQEKRKRKRARSIHWASRSRGGKRSTTTSFVHWQSNRPSPPGRLRSTWSCKNQAAQLPLVGLPGDRADNIRPEKKAGFGEDRSVASFSW